MSNYEFSLVQVYHLGHLGTESCQDPENEDRVSFWNSGLLDPPNMSVHPYKVLHNLVTREASRLVYYSVCSSRTNSPIPECVWEAAGSVWSGDGKYHSSSANLVSSGQATVWPDCRLLPRATQEPIHGPTLCHEHVLCAHVFHTTTWRTLYYRKIILPLAWHSLWPTGHM